jgi:hypothetical protein
MVMNAAFATTVAVVVPVILLAVGAEAREFEARTRGRRSSTFQEVATLLLESLKQAPNYDPSLSEQENTELENLAFDDWLRRISESAPKLIPPWLKKLADTSAYPNAILAYFAFMFRLITYAFVSAIGMAWLSAVVCLTIVEGQSIYWLGQENPTPQPGVAQFALVTIMASMSLLFATPVLRLIFQSPIQLGFMPISPRTILAISREFRRVEGTGKSKKNPAKTEPTAPMAVLDGVELEEAS